jgi:hypothetical protein
MGSEVGEMTSSRLVLAIALLTFTVAVAFIGYAATGADLCLWCAPAAP